MESCCFYSSSGFSVTKNDNIRRTNSYPKQIVTHLVYFGTQEIQTFWLVQTEKCAHLQKNLNGKNITGCVNDCKNILNTTWKNHKRTFCKYSLQLALHKPQIELEELVNKHIEPCTNHIKTWINVNCKLDNETTLINPSLDSNKTWMDVTSKP